MSRLADSRMYRHLWATDEVRPYFSESGRIETWLTILVALAQAQAAHGVIPAEAAVAIRAQVRLDALDLDFIAEETQRTSHSTLGLIRDLERVLPPSVGPYVYYGATVQDVTDTWTALTMKRVGAVVWRDLRVLERAVLDLADRHRRTVMAGRTHGQIGSVITLGLKLATWADEIRRHLDRLREGRPRWLVGQLAGSVGTMAFLGNRGIAVRDEFCRLLGLYPPEISWTASRDRIAEFCGVLAMVATTMARIGDEVYELQRSEIGELSESGSQAAVGSITMPHKQNPEGSEHLVTLGKLVRANAAVVLDAAVQSHERDGRGWKAEWIAFPEVCLFSAASLRIAGELVRGLRVDEQALTANLTATRGYWASESALVTLSQDLGKHRAHELLYQALRRGWDEGKSFREAVNADADLRGRLTGAHVDRLLAEPDTRLAEEMVDRVLAAAAQARAAESESWR